MTEDEAMTMICPILRAGVISAVVHVAKGAPGLNEYCKCLGHECMVWRWDKVESVGYQGEGGPERRFGGHCGLAGELC